LKPRVKITSYNHHARLLSSRARGRFATTSLLRSEEPTLSCNQSPDRLSCGRVHPHLSGEITRLRGRDTSCARIAKSSPPVIFAPSEFANRALTLRRALPKPSSTAKGIFFARRLRVVCPTLNLQSNIVALPQLERSHLLFSSGKTVLS